MNKRITIKNILKKYPFLKVLFILLFKKTTNTFSLIGFFLYTLELMETGKDFEILSTNLKSFFWKKVKNIIRQNKKVLSLNFYLDYSGIS